MRQNRLWGNDDPLFPKTEIGVGPSRHFEATGLLREHWSTVSPISAIFQQAFERAGLPYFNPHSFRSTLAQLWETLCQSPEQFKAWSQNLGHEGVLTTFYSYGGVGAKRQAEIIRDLAILPETKATETEAIAQALLRVMRNEGMVSNLR